MANYSTDDDLLAYEPDILDHGIAEFADDHTRAKDDLDRMVESRWFRSYVAARVTTTIDLLEEPLLFDSTLLLTPTQLKKASVFRVLGWYAMPRLSKAESRDDRWANKAKEYKERFEEEINLVLSVGLDYDWDESGVIDLFETKLPAGVVRIDRC